MEGPAHWRQPRPPCLTPMWSLDPGSTWIPNVMFGTHGPSYSIATASGLQRVRGGLRLVQPRGCQISHKPILDLVYWKLAAIGRSVIWQHSSAAEETKSLHKGQCLAPRGSPFILAGDPWIKGPWVTAACAFGCNLKHTLNQYPQQGERWWVLMYLVSCLWLSSGTSHSSHLCTGLPVLKLVHFSHCPYM